MRRQQDPLFAVWMPVNDQVGNFNVLAGPRVTNGKRLLLDLTAELLKVLAKQFPLGSHPLRTARARTERADLFQVFERPRGIDRILVGLAGRAYGNDSPPSHS